MRNFAVIRRIDNKALTNVGGKLKIFNHLVCNNYGHVVKAVLNIWNDHHNLNLNYQQMVFLIVVAFCKLEVNPYNGKYLYFDFCKSVSVI